IVSFDCGRTWSGILNQPTAQFYSVDVDTQTPYHLYAAQQDNWAICLPSMSFEGAITVADWVEPGGGESGGISVGKTPPHYVFGGGTGSGLGHGRIVRWDPRTGQRRNVTVWPEIYGTGAGAEAHRNRFRWTTPIHHSPHEPSTLYAASNVVHKSIDDGTTWTVISPDLTRAAPDKLTPSGGPITIENAGPENYCTISSLRESPRQTGHLWAGSDDGLVHRSV